MSPSRIDRRPSLMPGLHGAAAPNSLKFPRESGLRGLHFNPRGGVGKRRPALATVERIAIGK
jgi:hypothetical protein